MLATVRFTGMEALLTFVIRAPYHRGLSWPVTLVGVIAALLLILGYTAVPFEIWKRKRPRGGDPFRVLDD